MATASALSAPRLSARRGLAAIGLLLTVLTLHGIGANWLAEQALALRPAADSSGLRRLTTVFVSELRPQAPPVAAPPTAPAPVPSNRRAVPSAIAAAASAATRAASANADADVPTASDRQASFDPRGLDDAGPGEPDVEPSQSAVAVAPLASASAPDDRAARQEASPQPSAALASPLAPPLPGVRVAELPEGSAAAGSPPGGWPLSTRLTYSLTGNFRGPVDGQASVEWLRQGSRYQVHVEVSVGPSLAPLVSRRLSSDGLITADGLAPRRYEEVTRMILREPRRRFMRFDASTVRLADGRQVLRPPGLQDTASQFVQLTWLFTMNPARLRTGESIALMLALPQHVDPWVYDVLGQEQLHTPVGAFDAVLVRPRQSARPGDLTAELWVAPTLQFLPVRIVIRQDSETFVDLLLDRLPQQEADPAAQASPNR
jgi:hypothetical protein